MAIAVLEGLQRKLRRRTPAAVARLEVHRPALPGRVHPLHGGCYRLGRAAGNDIVIDHGAVSRQHALLENHDGHWLLSDNASTNGLWWHGRRVRELLLRDGDRVRFGPDDQADLPTLLFRRDGGSRWKRLGVWAGLGAAGLAGAGTLLLALSLLQVPTRGSLATVRGPLLLYDRRDRPVASLADRKHRELAAWRAIPPFWSMLCWPARTTGSGGIPGSTRSAPPGPWSPTCWVAGCSRGAAP